MNKDRKIIDVMDKIWDRNPSKSDHAEPTKVER